MRAPFASIAIPVFNGMPYIAESLADALGQDYENYEVVVIDNASTDGTREFLASLEDPRLRVIRREEVQPAELNWTQAVSESSGEYIKVACADDRIASNALSRQISALQSHPHAVLAASRRRIIGPDGKVLKAAHGLDGLRGEIPGRSAVKACMIAGTNLLGEVAAMTFRTTELKAAMPWDGTLPYMLDLATYSRLLRQGSALCEPEVLASFRVSPTSWSSTLLSDQLSQFRAWRESVEQSGWVELSRTERIRAEAQLRIRTTARKAYFARVRRTQPSRQSV